MAESVRPDRKLLSEESEAPSVHNLRASMGRGNSYQRARGGEPASQG